MDISDFLPGGSHARSQRFRVLVLAALLSLVLSAPSGPALGQTGGGPPTLSDLLDQTVSSASKYAQKSSEAPASITIITAEEIERYGFRNLAEALKTLTSFSIATDHSYTYTGVRGFARPADYNNRVLILLDGHTHNENVIGAGEIGSLRFMDVAEVERVEVVRGPGSSLYGTRAMFAVINVITKRGAGIDGARVWGEAGSYGRRMAGFQFGRLFLNGLDLAVSGGWSETDGEEFFFPEFDTPETNNGLAQGLNRGEMRRMGASVGLGDWRLWGAYYDQARGTPTAPHGSVFNDPRTSMEDDAWILDLQYEKELSPSAALTLRTYANHFATHHCYPLPGNMVDVRLDATWAGAEGRLRWDLGQNHRLVVGTEVQRTPTAQWLMDDELGVARFDGDYPYTISSFFVQDEFQVTPALALTLGARHDSYSTGLSATTPRAAVVYHPLNGSTLKVLWGTAFRAPNIYESRFESSYAGHVSNPDLDAERIRSTEVVFEQRLAKGLAARIGVFRNDVAHLIDQQPVAFPEEWPPSPTGRPYALRFGNGEDVRAEGIEAELNGAFSSGFLGYLRYAVQRAKEMASGAQAPNYPSRTLKLGGTYVFADKVNVGGNFLWESERTSLAGPKTEGYSLLDITVSSRSIMNHLTLSVSAKNLLDTQYSLPSGPQHALVSIPQPGRSILFRAGVQW